MSLVSACHVNNVVREHVLDVRPFTVNIQTPCHGRWPGAFILPLKEAGLAKVKSKL